MKKKNEQGKICVYKKDDDGNAEGETLGCHDNDKEADAQIAAVHASEAKAISLNQKVSQVRDAFWAQQSDAQKPMIASSAELYCEEVYPDYIIAGSNGQFWKVPYTEGDDGIVFAPRTDWQEVKLEREYVAKSLLSIKSLPGGRIAHYGVLWGDEAHKDLTGEFFTPETEELMTIFNKVGKLPLMYHHGQDKTVKATPIGTVDMMGVDTIGVWYQAQLDLSNEYTGIVQKLIGDNALGSSSGVLPAGRRVASNGKMLRWPIMEMTLTPAPAEYRMKERPIEQIKAAYKAVNLEFPEPEPQGDEESRQKQKELELLNIRFDLLAIEAQEL